MDRSYFLRYYEFEKTHWWFRARAEILKAYIAQQCSPIEGKKILNVGAATGGSIAWLSELGLVTSLEFDKESVLFIRDYLKVPIQEGSILSLPFTDNAFDLVCAFDVIEHVEDDAMAVRELARVCKVEGSVVVTVPAHRHLWSQHDVVNHHFRRYSHESLTGLFEALPQGRLEFSTYFNHYFYLPILAIRKMNNFISRWVRNQPPKSDFENFGVGWFNEICFSVMNQEKNRVSTQRAYRTGVSLLAHWKKH